LRRRRVTGPRGIVEGLPPLALDKTDLGPAPRHDVALAARAFEPPRRDRIAAAREIGGRAALGRHADPERGLPGRACEAQRLLVGHRGSLASASARRYT